MPLPLLPTKKVWNPFPDNGLQIMDPVDFKGRLYTIENINASGIPDILAYPFVFSRTLDEEDSDAYRQFSILIKGIFLGIIRPEEFKLNELGRLGDIIKIFHKDMEAFVALKWHGNFIGGIYYESIVFPAIELGKQDKPDESINYFEDIDNENKEKESALGPDEVKGNFRRWVINITAGRGNTIWARCLWNITNNEWRIRDNYIPTELVDVVELVDVGVSKDENSRNIVQIPLSSYMGHIITCNHNNQSISLSDEDITLSLGAGKMIVCSEQSTSGCMGCNMEGRGPRIDEAGFFERSRGEFIIWEDASRETLPRGCTNIEYFPTSKSQQRESVTKNPDYAILTFGRLKIKIEGRVVNKNDILCQGIVRFNDKMMPNLPIKSEYLDCIDEDTNSIERGPAYTIKLKGKRKLEIEYSKDDILEGGEASILLFPSFNHPGWKVNYIFFYWPKIEETQPNLKITPLNTSVKEVNYNEGNRDAAFTIKYNILDDLSEGLDSLEGIKTNQKITHIEILENRESKGIYFVRQNQLSRGEDEGGGVKLSLDFGTSNSIFAYEDARDSYKVLELKDMTIDILDNTGLDRKMILDNGWWLPSYIPKDKKALSSIPSELLFRQARDISMSNLDNPILKYTIPNPNYVPKDEKNMSQCVILDFKWMSQAPFNTPARNQKVKTKYLEILLHMALATIKDMGYDSVDFTATYPLAFGHSKYEEYKDLLTGDIIPSANRQTGMTINFISNSNNTLNIEFISESRAGRASFSTGGYQIVVDIGGGTTDISLNKGDEILVIDSIEYGGNKFVQALSKEKNLVTAALDISDEEGASILDIEIGINRRIRSEGGFLKGILNHISNTDRHTRKRINDKLEFFFNGILEYIKILITKYEIKDNVTLYPIGNAWKFMEANINNVGLQKYVGEYFDNQLKINSGALVSGKRVVAEGALRIPRFTHPDLHKPVMTVVGCDGIQIGAEYIDKNAEIPYCLQTDDHDGVDGPKASTEKFIENYQRNPKNNVALTDISEEFNTVIQNALHPARESGFNDDPENPKWYLTKSPFGLFLEKIVPKYYL